MGNFAFAASKKWIIAILLGMGISIACNTSYVRLEFPEDIINGEWEGLDSYQDSSMSKMCSSYIPSWWFLGFEGVDALPSVLDSNIFIVNSWDADNIFLFFAFSQSEHTIVDVIKDEFYHYQECGYIAYSKEKLDSMFVQMDETLGTLKDGSFVWYEYPCSADYRTRNELVGIHFAQSFCSDASAYCPCYRNPSTGDEDSRRVIDSVYNARCKSDGMRNVSLTGAGNKIVVDAEYIQTPNQFKNHTYYLMDVQGRVLEQGRLGSRLKRPKQPVVLQIVGAKPIFVK
ncbi:hypothetical protein [Fibrobacter sp.]|uniref:hypothetical protein n=1 Tax=Fibrobacter sp. TaxID=35828 RepID=UPI0038910D0F